MGFIYKTTLERKVLKNFLEYKNQYVILLVLVVRHQVNFFTTQRFITFHQIRSHTRMNR
jgi:hypothetical protein